MFSEAFKVNFSIKTSRMLSSEIFWNLLESLSFRLVREVLDGVPMGKGPITKLPKPLFCTLVEPLFFEIDVCLVDDYNCSDLMS